MDQTTKPVAITAEQRLAVRSAIFEMVARGYMKSLAECAPDPQAYLRNSADEVRKKLGLVAAAVLPPEAVAVVDEVLAEMFLSVQKSTFDDIARRLASTFPLTNA